MLRQIALVALLAVFMTTAPGIAFAKQYAFMVGVTVYGDIALRPLEKPLPDVGQIGKKLFKPFGFKVKTLTSVKGAEISTQPTRRDNIEFEWDEQLSQLEDGDVVLFYFAGHALEIAGQNWLLASDSSLKGGSAKRIEKSALKLGTLMDMLAEHQRQKNIIGIFIIDACRNSYLTPPGKDATINNYLAPSIPPGEVFVLYSAGIGQEALDGKDKHSVFADALLGLLKDGATRLPLTRLADRLRTLVARKAYEKYNGHIQTPAYYSQFKLSRNIVGTNVNEPEKFEWQDLPVDLGRVGHRSSFRECASCPEMVMLEPGRKDLPPKFAIGRFEVTNQEWDACVRDKGCKGPLRTPKKRRDFERHPVTHVSAKDARQYLKWLNKKLVENGRSARYRLPSNSEWDFAARAGRDTAYSYGKDAKRICDYANGADKAIGLLSWSYQHCSDGVSRSTAPVGRYRPNGFGLYDVHGNVWELTGSCRSGAKENCGELIARGGSWRSGRKGLRLDVRQHFSQHQKKATLGFRVVREIK